MQVYHTSFDIIENPDLTRGRVNADFGQGFYLSPDKDFSFRWAKRSISRPTYVNQYILDTEGLSILELDQDEEWFDFIFNNRKGKIKTLDNIDIIIGPIANDTLYETFGILSSGLLAKETALKVYKYGNKYTQIVIKTEKALNHLKYISSTKLTSEELQTSSDYIQEESEKFLTYLTKVLEQED